MQTLYTPLHFAAKDYRPAVARVLIASGALVDAVDDHGNTPLGKAVFESRGRAELIEILLAAGADRTKRNSSGVSPLDLAKNIANYKIPLEEQ
jgi:ankyrin repeat protein